MYGTKLHVDESAEEIRTYKELYGSSDFYAFPSLDDLQRAREDDLRDAGFGYRAKFIEGSVQTLRDMPEGGREWLLQLRNVGFDEAIEELCILPGVGPKVAACVALFSLDKHSSIPVDTHVWQFSLKHYTPHLRGKTNSPKYHPEVQEAFVKRFGEYAGWAHNTLFISELASVKKKLRERDAVSSSSDEDDCWYTSDEEDLKIETPPNKSRDLSRGKYHSRNTNLDVHTFEEYQNWEKTDPVTLFDAPTVKNEANPKARVCKHLQTEAKGMDALILWLDCDREGENICFEVIDNTARYLSPPVYRP
eukprot:jgi/Picre1/35554/NNA_003015.t1